jgi:hypothetical protein
LSRLIFLLDPQLPRRSKQDSLVGIMRHPITQSLKNNGLILASNLRLVVTHHHNHAHVICEKRTSPQANRRGLTNALAETGRRNQGDGKN